MIFYSILFYIELYFFPVHCKKKVGDFPVPSRDVTNQTLPGREFIPHPGEFGC